MRARRVAVGIGAGVVPGAPPRGDLREHAAIDAERATTAGHGPRSPTRTAPPETMSAASLAASASTSTRTGPASRLRPAGPPAPRVIPSAPGFVPEASRSAESRLTPSEAGAITSAKTRPRLHAVDRGQGPSPPAVLDRPRTTLAGVTAWRATCSVRRPHPSHRRSERAAADRRFDLRGPRSPLHRSQRCFLRPRSPAAPIALRISMAISRSMAPMSR